MELTQEYLKKCLTYDPDTGIFIWNRREDKSKSRNTAFAGKAAGCVQTGKKDGHKNRRIGLNGKYYLAYRLAWLYMTGAWPAEQIDHIDHDSLNDRWDNLREVSGGENQKNLPKYSNNTSGMTGVKWHNQANKWLAYITAAGKLTSGGLFTSFEDAVAKRKELEKKYSFHPNHGSEKLAV